LEMQFWLDKAVAWGQADSPDTQKDTCLHMSRLRDFLQQLLTQVNSMSSTTETMKRLPFLGQLLGRLCWNPYVTVCGEWSFWTTLIMMVIILAWWLLLGCLWGLYSEHPSNAVEKKANQWIRKVLCQLSTEEDDTAAQALMKCTGVPAKEYHLKVLRKVLFTVFHCSGNSDNKDLSYLPCRCSCDRIVDISEACIPIVTCPEASSLISVLLQRPVACVTEVLSEDFLNALTSAYSRQGLALEEQALVSLWYHSFSSLEEAVLSLLQSVITTGLTPQKLEQQVAQSLLVGKRLFSKAIICATSHHYVVKSESVLAEMPQGAWRNHLNWLSSSLQRLTEEEEEGDGRSTRGHHNVFEAWFLLVQCAHWVQVAVQLLATSGTEDGDPFLWLLIFYHYPTKRWHHRASRLAQAKEAWNHIRTLFSGAAHPLPSDRLQSLDTLVSPQPEQQSLAPSLTVSLLVNVAVFCQLPPSGSAEVLQAVRKTVSLLSFSDYCSIQLLLNAKLSMHNA
uniref:FA complementation group C n=1 Tax=Neolamprologus brichardi TaxID=32507 RepID=A0A3Q4H4R7_NEOBR